jgi:pyruvate/2-oxoglutarate dehydrogenase complex dihydrolipoamide acyltransferase (E2) component
MDLRLPELGEGIADATVVAVPVKAGQAVKAGDTLLEVETDKAAMPVPATADGTVSEIKVKVGDKVKVGAVIAVLGDGDGGAKPEAAAPKAEAAKTQAAAATPPAAPAASAGRRDFTLPNLGEGIDAGVIVAVSVKPGDPVTNGQELFTVETDKAAMPVPADADGKVEEVKVRVGDQVRVGAVLAVLSGGAATPQAASPKAEPAKSQPTPTKSQPTPQPNNGPPAGVVTATGVVPAGPATRRYAREHGVNLSEVAGTARGGPPTSPGTGRSRRSRSRTSVRKSPKTCRSPGTRPRPSPSTTSPTSPTSKPAGSGSPRTCRRGPRRSR